ncbi:MAG TPA: single-stranded DNA-binding protein [Chitinophagaceae bacterium]|nr:single-stranded DNA-binding protein [Chitinophagaceae bacterium]
MIKLQVIGNLGKDCLTNNVNGKTVMNFSVAHTEKIKDAQGNLKDKTIWVECAYWSERTGVAPYLKKGTQVYVDGTPDLRTYTKNDGTTGTSLSLRVNTVQLIGGANKGGENMAEAPAMSGAASGTYSSQPKQASPGDINEPMDDLPF